LIVVISAIASPYIAPPVRAVKILVASFDPPAFPCARLRLLDPFALAPGVEVRQALEPRAEGPAFRMDLLAWADVIVTQRGFPQPSTRHLLEPILAAGKPVVYETDDCLPEVPDFLGKPHYREWGPELIAWVKRVDAVTVPTQALADYFAPHARRIHVLPNYLSSRTRPASLATARVPTAGNIDIGYAGNPGHRGDLALVAAPLGRVLERHPEVRVTFFGAAPDGFAPSARVRIVPPDFRYETFPARLAALGFDFALAPLVDNPFNRCVSNLKYLEYGALGIPGIFSRMPAYESVVEGRTGLLSAGDPESWELAIETLCADAALRERLATAAQRDVRAHWMLEPHAHLWPETYAALIAHARIEAASRKAP
jgi:glycosyltransferase involved in cell wall biosynthesis